MGRAEKADYGEGSTEEFEVIGEEGKKARGKTELITPTYRLPKRPSRRYLSKRRNPLEVKEAIRKEERGGTRKQLHEARTKRADNRVGLKEGNAVLSTYLISRNSHTQPEGSITLQSGGKEASNKGRGRELIKKGRGPAGKNSS